MKKNYLRIVKLLILCLFFYNSYGQKISFYFENPQITTFGTNNYYEVDITIKTTDKSDSFKMGSGQLYFNYNTDAFGENVMANNNIEISYPNSEGYICGQFIDDAPIPIYKNFVINDNTISRVSWVFLQNFAACTFAGDNVTVIPKKLCHLKIKYEDVNQDPQICMESKPVFVNQFYTAFGPYNGDKEQKITYSNNQTTQIINDLFDCNNYKSLSLEEVKSETNLFCLNPVRLNGYINFSNSTDNKWKFMI